MSIRRIARNVLLTLGGIMALVVAGLGLILWLGLHVNLNALRAPIADAASEVLGREFRIDGDVSVEASLWPTLNVQSVRIANADGFAEADFASLRKLSLQVGVLPLLSGKVHVRRLIADGVALNLESDVEGDNNWRFGTGTKPATAAKTQQTIDTEPKEGNGPEVTFEVDELSLTAISASYVDEALGKDVQFDLEKFNGSAGMETPLKLNFEGGVQDKPFALAVTGPALNELADPSRISPIRVSGQVVGVSVDVGAKFGYENDEPRLGFGFELGETDVGSVLAWLGVAEGLDLAAEKFSAGVVLHGNSLDKLARQSEFTAELTGGHWITRNGKGEAGATIKLDKGSIQAGPEQALALALNGSMGQTPISIQATGALLVDYVKRDRALPIEFKVEFADVALDLNGNVTVPIQRGPFDMELSLQGDNLSTFNETLDLDLPPLGPYRVKGRYSANETEYKLTDLVLAVGDSELNGAFSLDTSQAIPHVDVRLTAPRLQLNDFSVEGWSAEGGAGDTRDAEENSTEAETAKERTAETDAGSTAPNSLLSAAALNSLKANFDLSVEQVLSGEDAVGSGHLTIAVEGGRLSVQPLHLTIPGGAVELEFGYQPTAEGVDLSLNTRVDRFDYGILARRVDPDTKMGGQVFLDVALDASAKDIGGLMQYGRGHFDFALLPEKFDASVFDLWSVNLLSALSKKVDDEPTSVINCILARFTLEGGLMQDRIIFMDTTRMSVLGKADIDFNQQTLNVYAKPEAKRPEFFSVAVPVGVSGKFEKWGLDIGIVPVAWAGVSFITSPVHVPLRRLFTGGKPLEGEAACRLAWQESEKPPAEPKVPKSKAFQ